MKKKTAKKKINVLFIGESWFVHTMEAKGFDVFTFDRYEEATQWIKAALTAEDIQFNHIPCHLVESQFPKTLAALREYDVVMFSDVGANTFNLPMSTFLQLQANPSKLELVREYVAAGGGFAMIGGYLTFQGIQARGAYKNTVMEEILPVDLLTHDDRMEKPQGIAPRVALKDHAVLKDMPKGAWPPVLGYNRVVPKAKAQVVATLDADPMIALMDYGKGRTCAYATDCAPHWSPLAFCEWKGYAVLWRNIARWLAGRP